MIEVTAAVIENNGRILICRRPEGKLFGGFWEFPGGKTEPGESPEESLGREIREELNLEIEIGERIGSFPYHDPPEGIVLTAFHALLRQPGEFVLREHADARWIFPGDLDGFSFAPADRPFVEILRNRQRR
ncbi:MAG: (deoxy)nucleoside triphosphate pyrophosphohydrolase [Candidatus Aminicenantes bacterium]|nr:(deoxy)nucleoside triphosphate pyrophosphohydrolase [Candidatus Aminicenantes bacterium]